jgi:hypothetical protein
LNETGENKMKMTVIMCYLRMKFVEWSIPIIVWESIFNEWFLNSHNSDDAQFSVETVTCPHFSVS